MCGGVEGRGAVPKHYPPPSRTHTQTNTSTLHHTFHHVPSAQGRQAPLPKRPSELFEAGGGSLPPYSTLSITTITTTTTAAAERPGSMDGSSGQGAGPEQHRAFGSTDGGPQGASTAQQRPARASDAGSQQSVGDTPRAHRPMRTTPAFKTQPSLERESLLAGPLQSPTLSPFSAAMGGSDVREVRVQAGG